MGEYKEKVGMGQEISEGHKKLLGDWLRRVRESQFAHYEAAKRCEHWHYWLGVPVVVFTSAVGTSVFATLHENVDIRIRIGAGMISIAASVLASLQTFMGHFDRAAKHRNTGAKYGSLRRLIEQLMARGAGIEDAMLEEVRMKIDSVAEEAPSIGQGVWDAAKRQMAKRGSTEEKANRREEDKT